MKIPFRIKKLVKASEQLISAMRSYKRDMDFNEITAETAAREISDHVTLAFTDGDLTENQQKDIAKALVADLSQKFGLK